MPCSEKQPGPDSVEIAYQSGNFHKATVFIDNTNISPKYILFDDKRYENPKGAGGLVVTNVNPHYPFEILKSKHAVYFDERACNQLAFKLYFLGAESQHFKPVYPPQEMQKEDISSFNDIKIWEINY